MKHDFRHYSFNSLFATDSYTDNIVLVDNNLSENQLNEKELLLKPNQEVTLSMYMDKPIDMQLPATINLLVTQSEPAVKGDSVNSNNKEVTCETGLTIQVPMFIEENDVIKIDTKAISYITRV